MFKDLPEGETHYEEDGCRPPHKIMKEENNWEKEFDYLLEGLFVPPKHAGRPPVIDWSHWHSKESYEDIKRKLKSFIHQTHIDLLQELLDRFTEGNFIGISSVHKMIKEIKK